MYCLKCGRENAGEQVFCDSCLLRMSRYPVKADTAINLPNRAPALIGKKQPSRKRSVPPEEQVLHLRKYVRKLTLTTIVLTLLLGLSIAMLLHRHFEKPSAPEAGSYCTTIQR